MLKNIVQIILFLGLISCSDKSSKLKSDDSINRIKAIERFVPENLEPETYDTIIKKGDYKISIQIIPLKTFLQKKYQYRDFVNRKKLDYRTIHEKVNYRNYEIHLVIGEKSKIIVDTVFHKENFKDCIDNSEMKNFILNYYVFQELSDGKLIFNAGFDNPFSIKLHDDALLEHSYDLKTRSFKFYRFKNG